MEALLTPDVGFIFWHSVIMLMTLFVLGRFAWNPLLQFIKARENAHQKAIETRQQIATEIANVEKRKEHILEEAHAQSDLIIQKALDEKQALLQMATQQANQEKERIIQEGLQAIDEEKRATQSAIKKQTAALIIHTTEKLLAQQLNQGNIHQKLIEKMIHDVETTPTP